MGDYLVTVECDKDDTATWNYEEWKLSVVDSDKEVCSLNFNNKEYTLLNKNYVVGEEITWAGLNWYVIGNSDTSATIILKGNYENGIYGQNAIWNSSTSYVKLNTDFINTYTTIQDAIKEKTVIYDAATSSYVRLPYLSELSANIPNSSNTSFWTMSELNSLIAFGKKDGTQGTSYTLGNYATFYTGMIDESTSCSALYPLSCNTSYSGTNYISPNLTSVIDSMTTTVSSSYYSSACSYGYTGGNFYHSCTGTGYRYDYFGRANGYYANQATGGCSKITCYAATSSPLGYRPVMTVSKSKL